MKQLNVIKQSRGPSEPIYWLSQNCTRTFLLGRKRVNMCKHLEKNGNTKLYLALACTISTNHMKSTDIRGITVGAGTISWCVRQAVPSCVGLGNLLLGIWSGTSMREQEKNLDSHS